MAANRRQVKHGGEDWRTKAKSEVTVPNEIVPGYSSECGVEALRSSH
jgi:hypothetical protein